MQADTEALPTPKRSQEKYQSSRLLVWLLASLATVMFQIAVASEEQLLVTAITILCEAAVAGGLACWANWLIRRGRFVASRATLVVCLISGFYAVEILIRISTRSVPTLEVLLLIYFRNAVIVLAAFSADRDCRRVCCSISTFLAIFSSTLSHQVWLHALVALYAIGGTGWLMVSYWESLRFQLGATSQQRLPRKWLLGVPAALSLLIILPVAESRTRVIRGFMPSSGGMEWYSESARQGVGDGDALVAGTDNIQSFAPIEDAPFMTSHEPSLYDLFDDSYNEPYRPQKQDRAIALPPSFASGLKERHLAESKQAGKQFSTLRKFGEVNASKVGNRDSEALLYVKGRVPLHLKLESYDLYDGVDWYPEPLPTNPAPLSLQILSDRPWLRLPIQTSLDIYGPAETHALKIICLETNRIPSPAQLMGVHIDQVDRLDMYAWSQPDLIKLDRDKLPSLTVLHTQSRTVDLQKSAQEAFLFHRGGTDPVNQFSQCLNDESYDRIRRLAESLTAGVPPGWQQVQAIVDHVRGTCIHDPQARPPTGCENTAAHFLFDSKRGPDYLIASATTMLLRSLGYSVRLVSGFYADPARYDARHDQTPVLADNVHFWAEVRLGHCDWIPLEPTPGYQLLKPLPTFWERLREALLAGVKVAIDHALLLTTSILIAIGLWRVRLAIFDGISTLVWRWNLSCSPRERVHQTLRLLALRCRWMNRPCPADMTLTRWIKTLISADGGTPSMPTLTGFLQLADWASYAPDTEPPPQPFIQDQCLRAVKTLSRKRLVNSISLHRDTPKA